MPAAFYNEVEQLYEGHPSKKGKIMKLFQMIKNLFSKNESVQAKVVLDINIDMEEQVKTDPNEVSECVKLISEFSDQEDEEKVMSFKTLYLAKTKKELLQDLMECEDEVTCQLIIDEIINDLNSEDIRKIMYYHESAPVVIRVLKEKHEEFPLAVLLAEDSSSEEIRSAAKEIRQKFEAKSKKLSDDELRQLITEFYIEDCSEWEDKKKKGKNFAYCTAMCAMGGCEYQHRYFDTEREALESAYVEQMCGVTINTKNTCPDCYAEYMKECM